MFTKWTKVIGAISALFIVSFSGRAVASDKCEPFPLTTWANKTYNPEVGSNTYLLFALASLEAYGYDEEKYRDILFRVSQYDKPDIWEKKTSVEAVTGLHADVYYHTTNGFLDVLVAFRGTRGASIRDWYSNFSPITRWLPFANAYDSAREQMPAVITRAKADAGVRTVRFVATGHSLGGGISQYIANSFACFSAVTFDTSCVVGSSKSGIYPPAKIVNIYETGDELTRFCKFAAGVGESEDYRQFNVNVIENGLHHRMLAFVVGTSRMVTECQQRSITKHEACAIKTEDRRAHDLYCHAYGYVGPDLICEEKYWKRPTTL
jgi:hypothetical protein